MVAQQKKTLTEPHKSGYEDMEQWNGPLQPCLQKRTSDSAAVAPNWSCLPADSPALDALADNDRYGRRLQSVAQGRRVGHLGSMITGIVAHDRRFR